MGIEFLGLHLVFESVGDVGWVVRLLEDIVSVGAMRVGALDSIGTESFVVNKCDHVLAKGNPSFVLLAMVKGTKDASSRLSGGIMGFVLALVDFEVHDVMLLEELGLILARLPLGLDALGVHLLVNDQLGENSKNCLGKPERIIRIIIEDGNQSLSVFFVF